MSTVAEVVSAAKPLIGCSRETLRPRVLMMRRPPVAVPAAIVTAQMSLTQRGILNSGRVQELEPGGQVSQVAGLGGGEEGQGDDAHGLLRVVAAVAEAQIAGAEDLQLAEHLVDGRGPAA